MNTFSTQYINQIKNLLDQILEENSNKFTKAASIITEAIEGEGRIFAWGSTHSSIAMQDIYMRAGGLMVINAIFIPGLEALQIKPFGVTSKIERLEGYAEIILDHTPIRKGDVLIVVSASGRNAVPIEMAKIAKERGISVIAVTGYEYSQSVKARHHDGKNLFAYADVVLDNKVIAGDAILEAPGCPAKFGPVSGILSVAVLQCLMNETIEQLISRGITPPIFMSQNLDGGEEFNNGMIDRYRNKIFYLKEL